MGAKLGLKELIENGYVKTPAKIQAIYKGNQFDAEILGDGTIKYKGTVYQSLSVAAGKAMVDAGKPPAPGLPYRHANGWTFWKYVSKGYLFSLAKIREAAIVELNAQ